MTATDIVKAVATMLREEYACKVHGLEVKEGYDRPSFFVDVRPLSERDVNANYTEKSFYVSVTYFQDVLNEADNLKKAQGIAELLRPADANNPKRLQRLKVGVRYLPVEDFSVNYIGTEKNVLQVEFETEFQEARKTPEKEPYMKEISIKQELKKEG